MAYIGKSIESGTFSVLDTSGNTYNGSNTTFSLGTQVGSTAQLLVSHDGVIQKPGTDYTLASGGTQITFTTAPASGASIFIVEISGAVGGPLDADLNGTELILDTDGDTSITADTDDQIDIKIAGADDFQFTANTFTAASGSTIAAQALTATTLTATGAVSLNGGSFVFNEDSADVDFRIESNGNANMLTVNGGGDRVGIGADPDLGVGLHIKSGDSGASVDSASDELVVEGSGSSGMTILSATSGEGGIKFGNSTDNDAGRIVYDHNADNLFFLVGGTERVRILDDGAVKIVTSFFVETERDDTFKMNAEFGGNAEGGILLNDKDGANNGTFMSFKRTNTQIGTIRRNGTNDSINFNTSSDYRLKDGIVDLTGGIDTIKKLKPRKFYWKSDTDKNLVDGFIAHEVQDVAELSHAVTGVKDGTRQITDGDGVTTTEIDTQGLDYSKLVTYLTAALQEAITEIESLKSRVTTLEG